jgi:hypothetical protein
MSHTATGSVTLKLYKSTALPGSSGGGLPRRRPQRLDKKSLARFAMDGYDLTAPRKARGFINLYGLPVQVRGLKQKLGSDPRPPGRQDRLKPRRKS